MHSNHRDRKLLDLAYELECQMQLPGICEGAQVSHATATRAATARAAH